MDLIFGKKDEDDKPMIWEAYSRFTKALSASCKAVRLSPPPLDMACEAEVPSDLQSCKKAGPNPDTNVVQLEGPHKGNFACMCENGQSQAKPAFDSAASGNAALFKELDVKLGEKHTGKLVGRSSPPLRIVASTHTRFTRTF